MGTKCQETRARYALTAENIDGLEAKILEYSGLDSSQIEVKNVQVGEFKGEPVNIRTIICGSSDKPTLVFCHGYGGSGALFYKIYKQLAQYFYCMFIDVPGMGNSSRPKNFKEHELTPAEGIKYFNDYFEAWRVAMGNLDGFYLAGHSFGGYLMGNYAVEYHQHIKKLILLSPVGIKQRPPGFDPIKVMQQRMKEMPGRKGPPAWAGSAFSWAWKKKISVFGVARKAGRKQTLKRLSGYVHASQKIGDDSQHTTIKEYMYQIFMRRGTTEYALYVFFAPLLVCHIPLGAPDRLGSPNFPIAVSFVYGDKDWVVMVEEDGPQELLNGHPDQANSKYHKVPGAGHNMHMDNPLGFANTIINDLLGENLPVESPQEESADIADDVMGGVGDLAQTESNIPENNDEPEEENFENYEDSDEEENKKNN